MTALAGAVAVELTAAVGADAKHATPTGAVADSSAAALSAARANVAHPLNVSISAQYLADATIGRPSPPDFADATALRRYQMYHDTARWRRVYTALCVALMALTIFEPPSSVTGGHFRDYSQTAAAGASTTAAATSRPELFDPPHWRAFEGSGGGSSTGTAGGGGAADLSTTAVYREYTPHPAAVAFAFECVLMLGVGLDFVLWYRAFEGVARANNNGWRHVLFGTDKGAACVRAVAYAVLWAEMLAYAASDFTTPHVSRALRPVLFLTVTGTAVRDVLYGLSFVFLQLFRAAIPLSAFFIVWFGVIGFLLFTGTLPDAISSAGGGFESLGSALYNTVLTVSTWSVVPFLLLPYWQYVTRFSVLWFVACYFVVNLFVFKIIVQTAYRSWKEYHTARKAERTANRRAAIACAFQRLSVPSGRTTAVTAVHAPAVANGNGHGHAPTTAAAAAEAVPERVVEQSAFVAAVTEARRDLPRDFIDLLFTQHVTSSDAVGGGAIGLTAEQFTRCAALLNVKVTKRVVRDRTSDCCDRIAPLALVRGVVQRLLSVGLDLSWLRTGVVGMSVWNALFGVATVWSVVETVVSSHNASDGSPTPGGVGWPAFGVLLTIGFVSKTAVELLAYGPVRYFTESHFRVLEFACTLAAVIYFGLNGVTGTNKSDDDFAHATAALTVLRVVRLLRLFTLLAPFEGTIRAVRRTLSMLAGVLLLLGCVIYSFALLGTALFGDEMQPLNPAIGADSKWGKVGVAFGYGDFTASLITTYQVAMWGSWTTQLLAAQAVRGDFGEFFVISWRYFFAVVLLPMCFGAIMETLNANLAAIQAAADKTLKAKADADAAKVKAESAAAKVAEANAKPAATQAAAPNGAPDAAKPTGANGAPPNGAADATAAAVKLPAAPAEVAVVPIASPAADASAGAAAAGDAYQVKVKRVDSLITIAPTAGPAAAGSAPSVAAAPSVSPALSSASPPSSPSAAKAAAAAVVVPRSPLSINTHMASASSSPLLLSPRTPGGGGLAEPGSPTSPGGSKRRARNMRARDAEDLVVTVLSTRTDPTSGVTTPVYGPAFAFQPLVPVPAAVPEADIKLSEPAKTTIAAVAEPAAVVTRTWTVRHKLDALAESRIQKAVCAAAIEDALAARPLSARYGFDADGAVQLRGPDASPLVDVYHSPVWRACYMLTVAVALLVLPLFEPPSTVTPRGSYPDAPKTAVAFEFIILLVWLTDLLMHAVTTPARDRRRMVWVNTWYLLRAVCWAVMFCETCWYAANDYSVAHLGRCLRPVMVVAYPGRVRKMFVGLVVTVLSMGWVFALLALHVVVFGLFGYLWLDNQRNNDTEESGGSGGVTGFYQTVGQAMYNTLLQLTAYGNVVANALPYFANSRWNFVFFFANFVCGNLFVFRIVAAAGFKHYKAYMNAEKANRTRKRQRVLHVAWHISSSAVSTAGDGADAPPAGGASSDPPVRVMTLDTWRGLITRVRRGLIRPNIPPAAAEAMFHAVTRQPDACVYSAATHSIASPPSDASAAAAAQPNGAPAPTVAPAAADVKVEKTADGVVLGVNRIGFNRLVRLANVTVSAPPAQPVFSTNPLSAVRHTLRRLMEEWTFHIAYTASTFAYYQLLVQALVFLAAVQLVASASTTTCTDTSPSSGADGSTETTCSAHSGWEGFGHFLLAAFAAQVLLELFVYGTDFIRSAFRCLDAVVLVVAIIGAAAAGSVSSFALMFRLLRLLRLLTVFKAAEETANAVRRSVSLLCDVIFVLFAVQFVYAVVGVTVWTDSLSPANPLLTPGYRTYATAIGFADYQNALCTLVHIAFWPGWSNALESAVAVYPDSSDKQNVAYVYFWSWRLLVGVVLLPAMFSAVFEALTAQLNALDAARSAAAKAKSVSTAAAPAPKPPDPALSSCAAGSTVLLTAAGDESSDLKSASAAPSGRAFAFRVHLRRSDSFAEAVSPNPPPLASPPAAPAPK